MTAATQPERIATAGGRPARMAPREHGAYGQLGAPLAAALALGPSRAALAFAGAAVLAFVAHEPLLVVAGRRGPRARREHGVSAARRLAGLVAAAVALGAAGVASSGIGWAPLALPATLAIATAVLVAFDREATLGGEIVAGAALASAAIPIALAAGASPAHAFGAWAAWSLAFATATVGVRAVVAQLRRPVGAARRVGVTLVPVAALAALTAAGVVPLAAAIGAVPLAAAAVVIAAIAPHPRSLRRVGWTLVAATVVSAVVLVAALKSAGALDHSVAITHVATG